MKRIKKLLHDYLHWGFPDRGIDKPAYSCQFCDREILQDSTGAWFHCCTYEKEEKSN